MPLEQVKQVSLFDDLSPPFLSQHPKLKLTVEQLADWKTAAHPCRATPLTD